MEPQRVLNDFRIHFNSQRALLQEASNQSAAEPVAVQLMEKSEAEEFTHPYLIWI